MPTKTNVQTPSSVELRVLSTLRYELQLVDIRLKESSQDNQDFFKHVKDYMEDRIQSITSRIS